jgi:hypothetical protein
METTSQKSIILPASVIYWMQTDPEGFEKFFHETFEAYVEERWQELLKEEELKCQH